VVVALAHDLDDDVERPGCHDDVVDLRHPRQRVGDRLDVALGADPDHRLPGEAELERVGHGDDLHHAAVEQTLYALPHSRLGQPDGLPDRGVRHPAVLLQLLDDALGDVVEVRG
jgi:hypothetical protein